MVDRIVMISATDAAKALRRRDQRFDAHVRKSRRAAEKHAAELVESCRRHDELTGYIAGFLIGLATGALMGLAIVLRGWMW